MPNYPSFLASVKCRETKCMYWSEGKKNLQTWSSSAVFDNHFFIGSCFTEVGGKLIFKCAPFSPSMQQEHLSLLWQASPIAIVQYSDGTVLAIKSVNRVCMATVSTNAKEAKAYS